MHRPIARTHRAVGLPPGWSAAGAAREQLKPRQQIPSEERDERQRQHGQQDALNPARSTLSPAISLTASARLATSAAKL